MKTHLRQETPIAALDFALLPEIETLLLRYVEQNPGLRYKELSRLTGLANGVLSYHLALLERSNAIVAERLPRQTRYFPINMSDEESVILKHLRNKPERELIVVLLQNDICTFNELVEHSGKSQSTVSSHIKKLKGDSIVNVRYGERHNLYSLANKDAVAEAMSKYKTSFIDRIVENYSEAIESL